MNQKSKTTLNHRELVQAAADISNATNYLKENSLKFERIEKKFDQNFTRIFLILENDTKTGANGIVQKIADLEKWKADIDYVMANLRGQAMAYGAVGSMILAGLGAFVWWAIKILIVK